MKQVTSLIKHTYVIQNITEDTEYIRKHFVWRQNK